ncbi:hypothetical protein METBIDRAFT_31474 [Metschnikowia bicuspidata var. bicuspidata NRRL YB-4993]|uniref:Uncharacterized protein n=1 Tax=Metschnikowia bicuspidata var. bicuspidata NRRL YB-4993 TaxID=869754 RepID=A0A1A0HFC4_9ASCO|nr:hypothetical protein METBIDRAFT_31474 [Metschnikowia bicuspidata var. bicuspidata NRRL YB-4993]OBA22597.1 hypothetical protein METBIDRAFT_31474 [Metschnikowia bicuspidata var. bicuspidata NRRL YB-4993]
MCSSAKLDFVGKTRYSVASRIQHNANTQMNIFFFTRELSILVFDRYNREISMQSSDSSTSHELKQNIVFMRIM